MPRHSLRYTVVSVVTAVTSVGALPSPGAAAGDGASQRSCFPSQSLRSIAGEEIVKKGDHTFDGRAPTDTGTTATTVPAHLRGAIRRVTLPPGKKLIALTFDLCEQQGEVAGYDGAIFDYLRDQNVKATLFVGGKWMRSHAGRTEQLMLDPLFEIASHSDTHRNARIIDAATLHREIAGPQATYEARRAEIASRQCSGQGDGSTVAPAPRIALFRFPFGACNQQSLDAVNDAGLLAIQWDVSTGDPAKGQTAAAIANAMTHKTRPGSILISHANGRGWHTAAALPLAIPKLKAMGYTFVTVSELLAAGKPVVEQACYNDKPGDTDKYDTLFSLATKPKSDALPIPGATTP